MLAERRDNDDELPGRPEAKEPGQELVHPLADSGGDWGQHSGRGTTDWDAW